MTSDDARHTPDRRFSFSGAGSFPLFKCPICNLPKASTGRRLQRVQGARQWVCQACVRVRATA